MRRKLDFFDDLPTVYSRHRRTRARAYSALLRRGHVLHLVHYTNATLHGYLYTPISSSVISRYPWIDIYIYIWRVARPAHTQSRTLTPTPTSSPAACTMPSTARHRLQLVAGTHREKTSSGTHIHRSIKRRARPRLRPPSPEPPGDETVV